MSEIDAEFQKHLLDLRDLCSEEMADMLIPILEQLKSGELEKAAFRLFLKNGGFEDVFYGFDTDEERQIAAALLDKHHSKSTEH